MLRRRDGLLFDFLLTTVIIATSIVAWHYTHCSLQPFDSLSRISIVGTIAQVAASLLGFAIAATAIISAQGGKGLIGELRLQKPILFRNTVSSFSSTIYAALCCALVSVMALVIGPAVIIDWLVLLVLLFLLLRIFRASRRLFQIIMVPDEVRE